MTVKLTTSPRRLLACVPILAIEAESQEVEVSVKSHAGVGVDDFGDSEEQKRDEGGHAEHGGRGEGGREGRSGVGRKDRELFMRQQETGDVLRLAPVAGIIPLHVMAELFLRSLKF